MNLVFFSHRLCSARCIRLGRAGVIILAAALFLGLPGAGWYLGFQTGTDYAGSGSGAIEEAWRAEMERQRDSLAEARRTAEENLNALAVRLGEMQARVTRLDALGRRLTNIAGLEEGEFDFDTVPAQGGPHDTEAAVSMEVNDFVDRLDRLAVQLDDRSRQLAILEELLRNRNLQEQVLPAGRPIEGGWISSPFGMRTDPFSGKLEHHDGVDLAGRAGTEVVAVASGVVTWAGDRWGYGRLVEINHGNGYVTRYGHNREVLVEVGDTVKQGQKVALMGSTGRSTGPHVHFEVLRDGRTVDPMKYLRASR